MKNTKVHKIHNYHHDEIVTLYTCLKCNETYIRLTPYCSSCGNQLAYKGPLTFHNDLEPNVVYKDMEDAERPIYSYYAIDHNNVDVSQDEELYEQYCDHLYALDANGTEISYQEYYLLSPEEVIK